MKAGTNKAEHEQIREWLYRSREELSLSEQATLDRHLETCATCHSYAQMVRSMEGELRKAFHDRWDHTQVPEAERGLPATRRLRATPALAAAGLAVLLILAIMLRGQLAAILSGVDISSTAEDTTVSQARATSTRQPAGIAAETTQSGADEHLIAFVSLRDGNREIYVMSALGEGAVNLTQNTAQDYAPVWSPGGERIAFISNRGGQPELFVMQADGSQVSSLSAVPGARAYGEPSWSPDGKQLAVQLILEYPLTAEPYTQIYLVAADGSGAVPMTQTEFPLSNLEPKWSPVGNRIASRTLGILQAFPGGVSAGEPEQVRLSRGLAGVGSLAWSPDGSRLAYFANCRYCIDEDDLTPTVHLIEADGSNPQVLYAFEDRTLYSMGMSWSPDGVYLLMLGAESGGTQHLYLMAADGSQLSLIADLPAGKLEGVPDWSPDGSRLVYAQQENGEAGIYILDLEERLSGTPRNGLTRLGASRAGDSSPRWQP